MPGAVTTAAASSNTVAQGGGAQTMNSLVGSPTVVLANAASPNLGMHTLIFGTGPYKLLNFCLALLVTTGVKGLGQQGIRAAGTAQTVTLSPGGQPFQLITPLQRARPQHHGGQGTATARTIQRTTPITIKMATTNASQLTDLPLNLDN